MEVGPSFSGGEWRLSRKLVWITWQGKELKKRFERKNPTTKMPLIEVGPTIGLAHDFYLDIGLPFPVSYGHDLLTCESSRSVGSEDRMERNGRTDRRTEAITLPPSLMRSVTTEPDNRSSEVYATVHAVHVSVLTPENTWMVFLALSTTHSITITSPCVEP